MTDNEKTHRSWIEVKFRKAKVLCVQGALAQVAAQRTSGITKTGVTQERVAHDFLQSSAQVDTLVIPKRVLPKHETSARSKRGKRSPITVRFTEAQIAVVKEKAIKANRTIGFYIRMAALGDAYTPPPDKELRLALLALMRELMVQGNNLNQIARKLNAGKMTPTEGEDVLEVIKTPLLRTLSRVRSALARGAPEMS